MAKVEAKRTENNGSGEMLLMNGAIMSVFAHPIMGIEPSKGPFKVVSNLPKRCHRLACPKLHKQGPL